MSKLLKYQNHLEQKSTLMDLNAVTLAVYTYDIKAIIALVVGYN